MSVKLYMDVHVKRAVTGGLRRRGVDVLTAQEDGTTRLDDADLLEQLIAKLYEPEDIENRVEYLPL